MSTFSSILNKDYEGFMVQELNFSFSGSFYDSFSRFSISLDFPSNLIFELEPPTYPNGSSFLVRVAMRSVILRLISMTYASKLASLSSTGS
jgi:hypothetical protein